jgi:hypothetical protein
MRRKRFKEARPMARKGSLNAVIVLGIRWGLRND